MYKKWADLYPRGLDLLLHGVTGEMACVIIMISGIDILYNETFYFIFDSQIS